MRHIISSLSLAFLFFISTSSNQNNKTSFDKAIRSDLTKLKEMVEQRSGHIFMNYNIDLWRNDFNLLFNDVSKLTYREIQIETMKLLAKLKDGHTGAWNPKMIVPEPTLWFPIRVYYFEEGLYIIAADREYKDIIGARINKINGIPEHKVREKLFEVTNGENIYGDMDKAPIFFSFPPILKGLGVLKNENELTLEITKIDGKEKNVSIESKVFSKGLESFVNNFHAPSDYSIRMDTHFEIDWNKNRWNTSSLYELKYLPKIQTVYFKLNQLRFPSGESIQDVFREFWELTDSKDASRIILDLRSNGGGNLYNAWPFIFKIRENKKFNTKENLTVLIGRKTFSAATAWVSMLETHTNSKFVGEPSGGRPNQTEGINERPPFLENLGLDIVLSRGKWTHTNPLDYREYIEPDSTIIERFEDWMNGYDRTFNIVIAN